MDARSLVVHSRPMPATQLSVVTVPEAPALDPRVPDWPQTELDDRPCPICAGRRATILVRRPDRLAVGQCDACGAYYLPRIPTAQHLATFYESYSTTHQGWHTAKGIAAAHRAARRRRGGNGLLQAMARRHELRAAHLLELGCGRGSFLLDAKELQADVSGMEIDAAARRFVNDLGIPCHATLDAAAEHGPYDIIVALNLIEHLPDPRGWLQTIASLLRSGGMLVLWTPNAAQIDVLGAGWVGFRVDLDHLTYFSARTLSTLLLDAGLWPEAHWELSQAELAGFRQIKTPEITGARRWLRKLWRRAPVESWRLPQAGGAYTLCMIAGKPSE
jgi:2-polyprenyl-3-methyl-5-hydroxy-6-metoxy-1,4-benzoquinol methylase